MRAAARLALATAGGALLAGGAAAQTNPAQPGAPNPATSAAPASEPSGPTAAGEAVADTRAAARGVPDIGLDAYVEGRAFVDLDSIGDDFRTAVSGTLGGSAYIQRRRVQGGIELRVRDRQFVTGGSRNRLDVNGVGRVNAELLRDTLFFSGSASARLLNRDLAGNSVLDPEDELEDRDERRNLTQTYQVSAAPSFTQGLGDFAQVSGSYQVGYVTTDRRRRFDFESGEEALDPFRSSLQQSAFLTLANKPRGPLLVQLTGSYSNSDQDRLDRRFRTYSGAANLTYALNRRVSLLGSAGYSDYRSTRVGILVGDRFLRVSDLDTPLNLFDEANDELFVLGADAAGRPIAVDLAPGYLFGPADARRAVAVPGPASLLARPVFATCQPLADPRTVLTAFGGVVPLGAGACTDPRGNFIPDPLAPRQVQYEQNGLVWNVGARYAPGPRTFAELRVGQRFDNITVTGALRHDFGRGLSVRASLTDGIETFGSILTQIVDGVPTSFVIGRNRGAFLGGCLSGAGCLDDETQSVTSGVFRSRIGSVTVALNRRVTDISLTYTYNQRDYLEAGSQTGPDAPIIDPTLGDRSDVSHRLSLRGNRQLSEVDRITASIRAQINDYGLRRSGGANVRAGVSARYTRDLDAATRAFASLALSRRFIDRDDDTLSGISSRTNATLSVGIRRDLF